jgi:hypothetical protein
VLFALLWLSYAGAAQDAAAQGSTAGTDAGAGADSAKPAVLYVVRRGWHMDIGFAAADLQPPLNAVAGQFPQVRYLFFGFGDQHYLLAKDRNAPVSLAALWPGPGVILATGLASSPQAAFGAAHVATLSLTVKQMRDVQAFVWYSLGRQSAEEGGGVKPYAAGPYEGSLFFAATPRYSGFHTCNTWAAESLRAAALPIHSAGVIFAGQLWAQVRRLERKQSAHGMNGAAAQLPSGAAQLYRFSCTASPISGTAAECHPGIPQSFDRSEVRPRWSSAVAGDCCC